MSDSRKAYVKWREDRGIRISDDPIPATELWDAGWQTAQAQAGDGSHVGEALACGDPDRTIATFNSDRVPVGAKLYTAPPAKANQQLLEALKHIMKMQTFGYIVLGEEATTKARAAIAAAQEQSK